MGVVLKDEGQVGWLVWVNLGSFGKEGTSVEKMLPPDWPVSKLMVHFLD